MSSIQERPMFDPPEPHGAHREPEPDDRPVVRAAAAGLDEPTERLPTPPGGQTLFAQLTYTNFHRPDGSRTGWQVKDRSETLRPGEERQLLERISTELDAGRRELGPFLTPQEVDALPRRLIYGPLEGGAVAYWHAAQAGVNSSSRPGNLFVHVLLDRTPGVTDPTLRPSDLLRSPRWLRPWDADQVLATTLGEVPEPPWPPGNVNRAAAVEFLGDAMVYRQGTLAGLVDAVAAALERPDRAPRIVLGLTEMARADLWIAAVCHLMSPATSRCLFWSTAERARSVPAARAAGLHLVAVPREDLDQLDRSDDLVLISDDERALDRLGDLADRTDHVTRFGSRIGVTEWSSIVPVVVGRERAAVVRTLEVMDRFATEIGDRRFPGGWPLALAVGKEELAGVVAESAELLRRFRPQDLASAPEAADLYQRMVERDLGETPAELWEAYQDRRRRGAADQDVVAGMYLRRALDDDGWLAGSAQDRTPVPVPVPVLAPGGVDPATVEACRSAVLRRLTDASSGADVSVAAVAVRLVDFAVRARLIDVGPDGDQEVRDAVTAMMDRPAGPALLDRQLGPEVVERIGAVDEGTRAAVLRPWFDRYLAKSEPTGHRLSPLLLGWLVRGQPDAARLPSGTGEVAPTLLEAGAQTTLVWPEPSASRPFALLARAVAEPNGPRRATGGPPLSIPELDALLALTGPAALLPELVPAILAAPTGPELDALMKRVREDAKQWRADAARREVLYAIEFRERAKGWNFRREGAFAGAAGLLNVAEGLLTPQSFADPPLYHPTMPALLERFHSPIVAAYAVDRVSDLAPPPRQGVEFVVARYAQAVMVPQDAVREVDRAVTTGLIDFAGLITAAQMGYAGRDDLGGRWQRELALLHVDRVDFRRPLLDQVVVDRLNDRRPKLERKLVEEVRNRLAARLRAPADRVNHADAVDDLARRWWIDRINIDAAAAVLAPLNHRRWFLGM